MGKGGCAASARRGGRAKSTQQRPTNGCVASRNIKHQRPRDLATLGRRQPFHVRYRAGRGPVSRTVTSRIRPQLPLSWTSRRYRHVCSEARGREGPRQWEGPRPAAARSWPPTLEPVCAIRRKLVVCRLTEPERHLSSDAAKPSTTRSRGQHQSRPSVPSQCLGHETGLSYMRRGDGRSPPLASSAMLATCVIYSC